MNVLQCMNCKRKVTAKQAEIWLTSINSDACLRHFTNTLKKINNNKNLR